MLLSVETWDRGRDARSLPEMRARRPRSQEPLLAFPHIGEFVGDLQLDQHVVVG